MEKNKTNISLTITSENALKLIKQYTNNQKNQKKLINKFHKNQPILVPINYGYYKGKVDFLIELLESNGYQIKTKNARCNALS
mgnify:CR=1 FL=1